MTGKRESNFPNKKESDRKHTRIRENGGDSKQGRRAFLIVI